MPQEIKDIKDEQNEMKHDIYFDVEFKRLTEEIEQKGKLTAKFNRFKTNAKFNVGISNVQSQNGMFDQFVSNFIEITMYSERCHK